ncbi:uncharacterized protein EV420DRAFT_1474202 [Desarmillaria tabescens]|uniref:Uncharacterized protein n=1 Tax=Armillaria tabescens TaxID=1929756 RepID=A0AA39NJF9_ARMTA|nr:uncharacterized protein EV420DRAFT_1474202 [Desarmillaria tabescens]KAK0466764.1 hypothetical protein EV420DRAFT_1474202 [Desarmillaria tabescens]
MATLSPFFVSQTPVATEKATCFLHSTSWTGLLAAVLSLWEVVRSGRLCYVPVRARSDNLGSWDRLSEGLITGLVVSELTTQTNEERWSQYEPIWTAGPVTISVLLCIPGIKRGTDTSHILAKEPIPIPTNADLGFVSQSSACSWRPSQWSSPTMYKFNTGVSGLPLLVNTALDCDFPGLLSEGIDSAQGSSVEIPGLIASIFIITSFSDSRTRKAFSGLFPLSELPSASSIRLTFQSILTYNMGTPCLSSASALAGNNLFRSTIASVSPLFGRAFFVNLGLGPGSALAGAVKVGLRAEGAVDPHTQLLTVYDCDNSLEDNDIKSSSFSVAQPVRFRPNAHRPYSWYSNFYTSFGNQNGKKCLATYEDSKAY